MLWLILQAAVSYAVAIFNIGASTTGAPVAILSTFPASALNCGTLTPDDGTLRFTGIWHDPGAADRQCETPPIPIAAVPSCTGAPCQLYEVRARATAVGEGGTTIGAWSLPGAFLTAPIPPPVLGKECDGPLGNRAVAVFPTGVQRTTGLPGSRSRMNYQLASPNSPVTEIRLRLNGAVVAELTGDQLLDTAGMWFTMPNLGTHTMSLEAVNRHGCSREVAGSPLVVP